MQARPGALVRRLQGGVRPALRRDGGAGHAHSAQSRKTPQFLPRALGCERRGAGRGSDIHLLRPRGGRGADQQLDGAEADARHARPPVRGRDARAHDVCDPVQHGTLGFAHLAYRRAAHRFALCRGLHAHHDAHGTGGARSSRRRRLRSVPSLGRGALAGGRQGRLLALQRKAQIHRPIPRGPCHRLVRLGLWRQRAAWQEMLFAAHRLDPRARAGLARRAHADPRRREPEGREDLRRGGLSVGVRQDQSGDAGAARGFRRLEGAYDRRRHRLDQAAARRHAARDQSRGRILRRRARHEPRNRTRTR